MYIINDHVNYFDVIDINDISVCNLQTRMKELYYDKLPQLLLFLDYNDVIALSKFIAKHKEIKVYMEHVHTLRVLEHITIPKKLFSMVVLVVNIFVLMIVGLVVLVVGLVLVLAINLRLEGVRLATSSPPARHKC